MSSQRVLKADALLVLVTILAAAGWFFSLYAMRGMSPLLFIGARFLMAGAVLVVLGVDQLRRLDRRQVLLAVLSGLAMFLYITLWVEAIPRTNNLGVGAFIQSLGNIVAPVVGLLLFGIPVGKATWCGVAVALTGLACLSLKNGLGLSVADLLFLSSAVAYALYLNLNAVFVPSIPPLSLAAIQLSVVGVFSLALTFTEGSFQLRLDWEVVLWFLASVFVATSLRYFLLVKGQKTAPIGHAALIMNLEPVWTALSAAVLLGTKIGGQQLVGCVLIFLALVVHRLPARRTAETSS